MAAIPLLFLPGLLEDADAFAAQIGKLAAIAPCSVADLTRSDSIAAMAADALREAPPGPIAIAGHSMGGYVALEAVRQAPERVAKLALMCTNARADSAESTENRRRLMSLARRDFPAVIEALMPRLVTAAHLEDRAIIGTITEMALGVGLEAFMRQETAIIGRIDSRPHLAQIRCPTLVLGAREDALMPLETREEMARAIPGARLAVIEDCGHMATLEQPEKVTELLAQWLRGAMA